MDAMHKAQLETLQATYADRLRSAAELFKRLPEEGEVFTHQGWRFEVVDMDGRKIDKLLVEEIAPAAASPQAG